MEYFNNRPLNEFEQRMRAEKQCIACGTKVPVTKHRKKVDGKMVIVKVTWPFECPDCRKTRRRLSSPTDEHDYGLARASVQHEFRRRIGGSQREGL